MTIKKGIAIEMEKYDYTAKEIEMVMKNEEML